MTPCGICAVTDRRRLAPAARTARDEVTRLRAFVDALAAAGVDIVQIREPGLDAALLAEVARAAVAAAADASPGGARTRVIVNDRVDVALAARADGVHLRSTSLPAARVRALAGIPASWLIGRSAHHADELALDEGLDYWLFGTVFATASKPDAPALTGLDGLRRAVAIARRPLLAIGGITPARAAACAAAGAAGVAAISLFLPEGAAPGALGPARAVAALREALY